VVGCAAWYGYRAPWARGLRNRRRYGTGTWARLKARVIALAELTDEIDWDTLVDSTIVCTHQHAAGAANGG
jgi:hypothetical protein